ncbi:cytochrome c oxidase assembly protein [Puerhibacterium puerhi]|uniref:cytochrome c oxidase assembly protein n=1 Tax=Puerhibacterium puerhi TaxID=2692623 RepID=UPI00135858BD|nr:cytochrome c oxidase assembly protein [Puerhibacterium puerhi]
MTTRAPSTAATTVAPRPAWLVAAGPVAVVVALLAVLVGGGFSGAFAALSGFADPGAVVRWGLPVTTVLSEIAGAVTLGALVAAATLLPAGHLRARALSTAGAAAMAWALVGVLGLVLRYSNVSGTPLDAQGFGAGLGQFLTSIELGRTWLTIVLLAAVTSALALAVRGATGALLTTLPPLAALAFQASTGHAAGAANHSLATGAMFLHLVGAALWIGGLAAIAVLVLARPGTTAERSAASGRGRAAGEGWEVAVERFSPIAGWCFAAVAVSGVLNGWIRLGGLDGLGTRYGALLLAKAALMVVLGALGWAHRRGVVGRLTAPDGVAARGLFWRLLAVELAVMGAVSGVAVALSSTAPPVPDDVPVDVSPAYQLTGSALPPELVGARWFTEWRLDPLFAFACVAAVVVYLRWVRRLARRGDRWPVGRTVSWVAGVAIVAWDTNGAPTIYGEILFSAHMVQHMVLAMLVPLLLVLAAPITLLLRAVPPRKDGSRGPREWVLAFVHSRWGAFVSKPVVAAVVFVAGMIVFYYSPLFEWSLRSHVGHVWMVVHFTLAGYLFANALVGIDPGPNRPPYPQRLVLLFATMAFHAFFGVALMSQTSLLVADWFGNTGRPWGLPAIEDQQRGGAVAWGIGELPTVALAIVVAVMWTRSDEREARRRDRKADREGDVELDEYNAMLAQMARRDGVEAPDAARPGPAPSDR